MADLLIRGGLVIDGSGRPGFRADVLVEGDRIVRIGNVESSVDARTIEAEGLVVAPGFIDLHSHADFVLLAHPDRASAVRQGITTEVVGNCGLTYAPAHRPEEIAQSLPAALREIPVSWRTFDDYLSLIEQRPIGINIAHLVGLNALRLSTSGYDARPLTDGELALASEWLTESLAAGAWGFSIGLEYVPGRNATTEELIHFCRIVVANDGLFAAHMRNQDVQLVESVEEVLRISARSGVRLQISHLQPRRYAVPPGAVERALERIDSARAEGVDVAFDLHPYLWGMSFPTAALPPWAFEGGTEALLRRLADPALRAEMQRFESPMPAQIKQGRWETLIPRNLAVSADLNGLTMAEIGRRRGKPPFEALFDLLLEEGSRVQALIWIFELIDERHLHQLLRRDDCLVESDGLGGVDALHPRCFGWTARLLGEHVRERRILSLEAGIRRITALPAERLGLPGRGSLEPGAFADLVVFSAGGIRDRATYDRPDQAPDGIRWVVVNGEVAFDQGEVAPPSAGRLLRRGRR